MNNYNVIYIIKYSCIDAISIFNNPGAISSSLSQIDKYYDGYSFSQVSKQLLIIMIPTYH